MKIDIFKIVLLYYLIGSKMFEEIINSNDYIKYLEYLKIDTSVLKEKIQNKIEQEKGVFETY